MNIDKTGRAKRLLGALGEVDDSFLDEAASADIASGLAARRRAVGYSAVGVGAAASLGLAAAIWFLRPKQARGAIENVLQEIAS